MKISKLVASIALVGTMAMPALALANPLFVSNNTNEDSTTITNNTLCSTSVLGADGVTRAHEQNHEVSDFKLRMACIGHLDDCKSDVYMTNNCSGPIVAQVAFSVYTGIKSVTQLDPRYKMTGTGFNAQIDYNN